MQDDHPELKNLTCMELNRLLPCGITLRSLLELLLKTLGFVQERSRYYDKEDRILPNRVVVDYWNILNGQGWQWVANKRVLPGQPSSDYNHAEYDYSTDGDKRFIKMIVDQINLNDNLDGMPREAKQYFLSLRLKCEKALSALKEATAPVPPRRTRARRNYANLQRRNA